MSYSGCTPFTSPRRPHQYHPHAISALACPFRTQSRFKLCDPGFQPVYRRLERTDHVVHRSHGAGGSSPEVRANVGVGGESASERSLKRLEPQVLELDNQQSMLYCGGDARGATRRARSRPDPAVFIGSEGTGANGNTRPKNGNCSSPATGPRLRCEFELEFDR